MKIKERKFAYSEFPFFYFHDFHIFIYLCIINYSNIKVHIQ